ncbi:hypothetical protein [Streptomyces sp. NPDC088554]|uniref:hypothetical protein n=1 Tax=Streptomyces sp. NPDC088554 TaxID=3365865 RepID=UPI0037F4E25B
MPSGFYDILSPPGHRERLHMSRFSPAFCLLAALCLAAQPVTAWAARGTFTYTPPPASQMIENPTAARCYSYLDASGPTVNGTDQEAELFSGPNCSGTRHVLASTQSRKAAFRSVRFTADAIGYFSYSVASSPRALDNPTSNHCFDIEGEGKASNATDDLVLLYERTGCAGTHTAEIPARGTVRNSHFRSVLFAS